MKTPSDTHLARTAEWIGELASYWNAEVPLAIHSSAIADDGAPQWHNNFRVWLLDGDRTDDRRWKDNPEPRVRTTRAMRKLRERFPREYEVLYRTAILQIPVEVTTAWLNERAIRNDKPERYALRDTYLILIVAADHVASWW